METMENNIPSATHQEKAKKMKKLRRWQIAISLFGVAIIVWGVIEVICLFLNYSQTETSNDAQIEQYVSSMKEYMQVFYSNLKALESANDVFEKLYDDKKPVVMSVSQPVVSTLRQNFDSVFFPVLGVYLGKTTTIELRN